MPCLRYRLDTPCEARRRTGELVRTCVWVKVWRKAISIFKTRCIERAHVRLYWVYTGPSYLSVFLRHSERRTPCLRASSKSLATSVRRASTRPRRACIWNAGEMTTPANRSRAKTSTKQYTEQRLFHSFKSLSTHETTATQCPTVTPTCAIYVKTCADDGRKPPE